MKKLILIIMMIGFTCQAQMGNTKEQCEKNYGKPVWSDDKLPRNKYKKNGLIIVIEYINNKCHCIGYAKINNTYFEMSEINNLLKINLFKWKKIEKNFWKSFKGDYAVLQKKTLSIVSEKYQKQNKR